MEQADIKDANKVGGGLLAVIAALGIAISAPLWWRAVEPFSDKPEVKACEKYVLGGLRSPSTYERVSAESTRVNDQQWVSLVYDAANAYGTPLRETELCKFRIMGDQVAVPHVADPDLARELRRLDESTGRTREPCCLE